MEPSTRRRNLLLAYGRFDDYVAMDEIAASLAQVAPGPATRIPGETTGDLAEGSGRRLVLAPWSQHGGEPFDPVILDEAAAWFARSFRMAPSGKPVTVAWRHLALLIALSLLLAGLARQRPAHVLAVAAMMGIALATGLVPALPGVSLVLGLLLVHLDDPSVLRHLAGGVLGIHAAVALSDPARAGAVALYEVLFLPSQAFGILQYWQTFGTWPWWALLGFLAGLGVLVTLAPDLLRGWLSRWTAAVRRPAVLGVLAGLTLWKLAAPAAVAALVYGVTVRLLSSRRPGSQEAGCVLRASAPAGQPSVQPEGARHSREGQAPRQQRRQGDLGMEALGLRAGHERPDQHQESQDDGGEDHHGVDPPWYPLLREPEHRDHQDGQAASQQRAAVHGADDGIAGGFLQAAHQPSDARGHQEQEPSERSRPGGQGDRLHCHLLLSRPFERPPRLLEFAPPRIEACMAGAASLLGMADMPREVLGHASTKTPGRRGTKGRIMSLEQARSMASQARKYSIASTFLLAVGGLGFLLLIGANGNFLAGGLEQVGLDPVVMGLVLLVCLPFGGLLGTWSARLKAQAAALRD